MGAVTPQRGNHVLTHDALGGNGAYVCVCVMCICVYVQVCVCEGGCLCGCLGDCGLRMMEVTHPTICHIKLYRSAHSSTHATFELLFAFSALSLALTPQPSSTTKGALSRLIVAIKWLTTLSEGTVCFFVR